MNKDTRKLEPDIRAGQACGYSIFNIKGYEIHCWVSSKTIYSLGGIFPHFNPKVGYHATIQDITLEEIETIKNGTFSREEFDKKLIEKFKEMYPHLWANHNG